MSGGKELKLLILDTCGAHASFALVDKGCGAPTVVALEGRSVAERLLPEIRSALASLGWELGSLAVIAVVSGPGSFTGARVGLAAAKGLCEAAEIPLMLISRLAVLARKAGAGSPGTVHALLNAGRGEFFYGRSTAGELPLEALLSRDAVLSATASGRVVACEPEIASMLPERAVHTTSALLATDALPLVSDRMEQQMFDDVAASDANYLRRTDFEVLERLRLREQTR